MSDECNYVVGQRWFNFANSELGLGLITAVDKRSLKVSFPAVEDDRTYALEQVPLCRIIYRVGDKITTIDDDTFLVTNITHDKGLLIYTSLDANGIEFQIPEDQLSATINFSAPLERLLGGMVDKYRDYSLKIKTLYLNARLHQSKTRGLIGARTEHIAHQVFIASEVAKRYAPRVLLADEVGLGKTIEAGLILHHQIITGRAQRILIIVPETLTHQWLVEMLRRFNLSFSLFNQERYYGQAGESCLDEIIEKENPFEDEQLIITSLDFLLNTPKAMQQAQDACWDLVVVDEAHHIHWHEESPSAEYQCIETFAERCQGLLLLTATPEQLGIESHFARLRLLDKARFQNLEKFKKEQENFQQIHELAKELVDYQEQSQSDNLPTHLKEAIMTHLELDSGLSLTDTLAMLLDQHGTGRVLFRNTRAAITGFPKRQLITYHLETPCVYQLQADDEQDLLLYPESKHPETTWLKEDPRVNWLIERIRQSRPHKVLVITANANTALALEKHLKFNSNIRASSFHEGLTIIERDRAAAYFSDFEEGAECLICSEIGSEGRNFQFAHELILFDLPLNPDTLEQRIGRLDRIGQKQTITIHVPVIKNTALEVLYHWYHQGLNLFEQSCSFGFSVYEKFKDELLALLKERPIDKTKLKILIEATRSYTHSARQKTEAGRDRLLELSSCNKEKSKSLIDAIEQEEDPIELQEYMNKVFNAYGVSHEYHSEHCEIIQPSEHMKTTYFPGLKDEGNTVTYSREKALVREDMEFLSYEHPMVREIMEMIANGESGSAVLSTMSLKNLPSGTLLLEAFYTASSVAPKSLELNRYLPLTPIRILTSLEGKNIAGIISHEQLSSLCKKIKRHHLPTIINQIRPHIEAMAKHAEIHAHATLPSIIDEASTKLSSELGYELSRLKTLKNVNPNIREEEISFIQDQLLAVHEAINKATLKFEALHVIINS